MSLSYVATPAGVETYIRLALAKGWKPTEKGKPFVLVAAPAIAQVQLDDVIPTGHGKDTPPR